MTDDADTMHEPAAVRLALAISLACNTQQVLAAISRLKRERDAAVGESAASRAWVEPQQEEVNE